MIIVVFGGWFSSLSWLIIVMLCVSLFDVLIVMYVRMVLVVIDGLMVIVVVMGFGRLMFLICVMLW